MTDKERAETMTRHEWFMCSQKRRADYIRALGGVDAACKRWEIARYTAERLLSLYPEGFTMTITKEKAIEILNATLPEVFGLQRPLVLIQLADALAAAGAFTDGAEGKHIPCPVPYGRCTPDGCPNCGGKGYTVQPSRPALAQPSVYLLVGARCGVVRAYFGKDAAEARRDKLNADPFIAPGTPDPDAPYEVQSWEVEP